MHVTRSLALSACCVALTSPTAALAAPGYAGDLEPTFVGWYDEAGKPAQGISAGQAVVAHYTVTNTAAYPVKLTGVDSELTQGACLRDIARRNRLSDPGGTFPIYLMPGESTKELSDVAFVQASGSQCQGGLPTWTGNVQAEQAATPFPTPATPRVTRSVATAVVTETHTETHPQPGTGSADATPFYVMAGIAAATILGGAAVLAARNRRRD